MPNGKIEIRNINRPGRTERKVYGMHHPLLSILPGGLPGMTVEDDQTALLPALPNQASRAGRRPAGAGFRKTGSRHHARFVGRVFQSPSEGNGFQGVYDMITRLDGGRGARGQT